MPDETLESIERTRLALKGPLETPVGEGYRSVNVALRKTFDLYANVRPARTIVPGGRYENVDIVLIRENTEGLYSGIEHYIKIGDDPQRGGRVDRRHHAVRVGAHRPLRVRVRARARAQEGHARPQGEHPQVLAGAVPRGRAADREGVRGPRRVRGADRRRDGDAARDQARSVRRHRHDEPVRRHPLRSRSPGSSAGWASRPARTSASDAAIFEAVHGTAPDIAGKGDRQPGRAHPRGVPDARARRTSRARARRIRDAMESVIREGKTRDARPRRHGDDRRSSPTPIIARLGADAHADGADADASFTSPICTSAAPRCPEQIEAIEAHDPGATLRRRRDLRRPLAARASRRVPARAGVHPRRGARQQDDRRPGNHDVQWWRSPLGIGDERAHLREIPPVHLRRPRAGAARARRDVRRPQHRARRHAADADVEPARHLDHRRRAPSADRARARRSSRNRRRTTRASSSCTTIR